MHPFGRLAQNHHPLLLLAPLASLSHRALRELISMYGGCDLFFTEMISSDALLAGSSYKEWYLEAGPQPERVIFQLVGSDQATLAGATRILTERFTQQENTSQLDSWAGIDINMGCSAPEMVRKGAGVHWMSQADAACRLIAELRPLIDANHSLSVKMRIGENADFTALARFCQGLENEGVDFLTLHPRLRSDPWARPARWSWYGQLARELKIPLIANGDIKDRTSLGDLGTAWTNAYPGGTWPAGIMIGRAAVRAPWIFQHLRAALTGSLAESPISYDLLTTAETFHQLLEQHQPQDFWLTRAKRFYAFFCGSMIYGNRIASIIQNLPRYAEILPCFRNYLTDHPEERMFTEK